MNEEWIKQIKEKHMDISSLEARASANIAIGLIIGMAQIAEAIDKQTQINKLSFELSNRMAKQQHGVMGMVSEVIEDMKKTTNEGEDWKKGSLEDDENSDN